jgi:hypothetical protein
LAIIDSSGIAPTTVGTQGDINTDAPTPDRIECDDGPPKECCIYAPSGGKPLVCWND